MLLLSCIVLLYSAVALATSGYVPESTVESDRLASTGLKRLKAAISNGSLKEHLAKQGVKQDCTTANLAVRREYSTLSGREKLAYTNSVKCLMAAPSRIPPGAAPGAKSRYDDFVAIHINETHYVHANGNFLSWHRYYLWAFETALRDECGYKGYLPYWNWAKSSKDPINSPYFDGSKYSQGGNGVWAPHNCTRPGTLFAPCVSPVVEGRGGGCVETGPYVGLVANLSRVQTWFDWPNNPAGEFLGYQPRCMKRDIMPEYSSQLGTEARLIDLLTNSTFDTIGPWQSELQSKTGLHGVGHFTYGGDPGGDIYTSPNDPMFWLHHAMVDRTWWVWQNQKPFERAFQIAGTRTMDNIPPSENATIEDMMDIKYLTPIGGSPSSVKHHMSTVGGPYCYVYHT